MCKMFQKEELCHNKKRKQILRNENPKKKKGELHLTETMLQNNIILNTEN